MDLYKKAITGFAALGLMAFASFSQAAIISLDPSPVEGELFDSVFVDLVYDGTGATPEYIGGWDLDLSFDDSILSFVDVTLDPDFGLLGGVGLATDFGGGLVNLFDLSLLGSAALMGSQDLLGNMFVLATLEFTAIGLGDTSLSLFGNAFSDADGIATTPQLVDSRATVVPEPGILPLMALSLLAMVVARRRRR